MTETLAPPTLTPEQVHAKMRQLRDAKSRIAEEIATCEIDRNKLRAELELVDMHQERVTKGDREFVAMLERELEAHLRNLRSFDDRVKSIRTPWGDVTSRAVDPVYRRDDDLLYPWASVAGYLRAPKPVTSEVDWAALKKACHVTNGRLVVAEGPLAGEVVPGVEVIEREPTVNVEVTP